MSAAYKARKKVIKKIQKEHKLTIKPQEREAQMNAEFVEEFRRIYGDDVELWAPAAKRAWAIWQAALRHPQAADPVAELAARQKSLGPEISAVLEKHRSELYEGHPQAAGGPTLDECSRLTIKQWATEQERLTGGGVYRDILRWLNDA